MTPSPHSPSPPIAPSEGDPFAGREILVGVTGGIAAYKVADLVSKLVQRQARVSVVMTRGARKFIGPTTFEALTNRPVLSSMYASKEHPFGEHIGLARRADLYLIAPASANTLAKLAGGFAGDLVSILALTMTRPVLVAPAMNNEMWSKPAVARNVRQLREDGVHIVEPDSGWLSCGAVGPGRMADVGEILAAVAARLPEETARSA
jgi:phosphopantothenoylcysteine decarboxylase